MRQNINILILIIRIMILLLLTIVKVSKKSCGYWKSITIMLACKVNAFDNHLHYFPSPRLLHFYWSKLMSSLIIKQFEWKTNAMGVLCSLSSLNYLNSHGFYSQKSNASYSRYTWITLSLGHSIVSIMLFVNQAKRIITIIARDKRKSWKRRVSIPVLLACVASALLFELRPRCLTW